MSELRNPLAPRWDWDRFLKPYGACFPRGISFGDLDGEIEIHRHFLVTEGKRMGESLSNGQRYAMDARVKDGRTVLIIYGNPPGEIMAMQHWAHGPIRSASWCDVWNFCKAWAQWADTEPPPAIRLCGFRNGVPA
jgi:hypothetical protein